MLMTLLEKVARGGFQQPADLAAELGIPVSLVEQMLSDLERMGYLKKAMGACSPSNCAHCKVACALPVQKAGQAWLLTPKGTRALGR